MIGPTGVGKTEIARRLAKLTGAPFIHRMLERERRAVSPEAQATARHAEENCMIVASRSLACSL